MSSSIIEKEGGKHKLSFVILHISINSFTSIVKLLKVNPLMSISSKGDLIFFSIDSSNSFNMLNLETLNSWKSIDLTINEAFKSLNISSI